MRFFSSTIPNKCVLIELYAKGVIEQTFGGHVLLVLFDGGRVQSVKNANGRAMTSNYDDCMCVRIVFTVTLASFD